MLGATLDEQHTNVEREGRDDEQGDDAAGEQDEDLSPLAAIAPAFSC